MRRVSVTLAALAVALLVALPAGAAAQDESAIDEYIEQIPGAGGDEPSADTGGGGNGDPLPPSSAEALRSQGPAGIAAADLAEQTAPAGGEARGSGGTDRADAGGGERPDASGGLPAVDEVAGSLGGGDDGGLGVALPIILGLALAAAIAFALIRRRRGPGGASEA